VIILAHNVAFLYHNNLLGNNSGQQT